MNGALRQLHNVVSAMMLQGRGEDQGVSATKDLSVS